MLLSRVLLLGLLVAPLAHVAPAQTWPAKPLRLLVPFPPGAAADLNARLVAPKLSEQLKQPVLIENRPGAASIIAMEATLKAPADGYTLFFANPNVVTSPLLFEMNFDPVKELVPVIQLTVFHYVLLASNSFAPNSVGEILELAREKPGVVTCASGGGMSEFGCGLLRALGKADITQVRYKGNAPAMNDLAGGQVNLLFDIVSVASQNVKTKRARAIAISSPARAAGPFSHLPTLSETLPGFEVSGWQGVMLRAGTPRDIVERLNREFDLVLAREDVRKRLVDLGVELIGGSPESFAGLIRRDQAKFARIIREFNIRVD